MTALAALACASACGRPVPGDPGFPVPPDPTPPTAMPAPVLGRFEQPAAPRPQTSPPEHVMIQEPPGPPLPRTGETPVTRESFAPPPAGPPPTGILPDEVVLQMLEHGRAAFVWCFKKAIAEDPTKLAFKVTLHVEIDEHGALTRASTDAETRTLDACLVRTSALLQYPASGQPVAVEMPLFYRGEP